MPGVQVLNRDSSLGRPSALWGSSGCGHRVSWLIARDLMMQDPDPGLTATQPNPHLLGPDIPAPDKAVSTPAPRGPVLLELLVVPLFFLGTPLRRGNQTSGAACGEAGCHLCRGHCFGITIHVHIGNSLAGMHGAGCGGRCGGSPCLTRALSLLNDWAERRARVLCGME